MGAAGLGRAEHPLLGAVTELADQDQVVLSGRLSASTGWLAGHVVLDSVVFPATGFIDVLLRAGEVAGCPVIDELVLHTPLVLVAHTPTDLQITVQPVDDSGQRCFGVYSRTGDEHASADWILHASGVFSVEQPPVPAPLTGPRGVQAVDQDGFYQGLAAQGLSYGGPFRSVRGIGRHPDRPDVVFAEVELPADTDVTGYGIHPALLDAALQPLAAAFYGTASDADLAAPRLPFAFTGISLHAIAATRLHVELTSTGPDTFTVHATDPTGAPVITIQTLSLRELPAGGGQLAAPVSLRDSVFELSWPPVVNAGTAPAISVDWAVFTDQPDRVPAGLQGGPLHTELATVTPAPELVIWVLPVPEAADEDPLKRLHALTGRTLAHLQDWLSRPETVDTHLVVVTRHAVTTTPYDPPPDLAHAAAWALIHSAQNEHPGRITVIDTDDTAASDHNLVAAVSPATGRRTPTGPAPGHPAYPAPDPVGAP